VKGRSLKTRERGSKGKIGTEGFNDEKNQSEGKGGGSRKRKNRKKRDKMSVRKRLLIKPVRNCGGEEHHDHNFA